jgi:hypothetical protein
MSIIYNFEIQNSITPIKYGKSCVSTTFAILFSLHVYFGFKRNGLRNLTLLKKIPAGLQTNLTKMLQNSITTKRRAKVVFT